MDESPLQDSLGGVVLPATPEMRKQWSKSRWWHAATLVIGGCTWLFASASLLFSGDHAFPGPGALLDDVHHPRRRASGTWQCRLLLGRTKGWSVSNQPDLHDTFSARWRGPGAFISGSLSVISGGLLWSPRQLWRSKGAREFLLPEGTIKSIYVLKSTRRATAVVIIGSDGEEVWLKVSGRDFLESAMRNERPRTN